MRPRTSSGHLDGIWAGGPHARQRRDRLFLLAREQGVSARDAAAFAGFGARTVEKRGAVKLPRSYTGRPWARVRVESRTGRSGPERPVPRNEIEVPYAPSASGPLAGMTRTRYIACCSRRSCTT